MKLTSSRIFKLAALGCGLASSSSVSALSLRLSESTSAVEAEAEAGKVARELAHLESSMENHEAEMAKLLFGIAQELSDTMEIVDDAKKANGTVDDGKKANGTVVDDGKKANGTVDATANVTVTKKTNVTESVVSAVHSEAHKANVTRKHKKFEFPPELQKLEAQLSKPIEMPKIDSLTIMVPMLESMSEKFKDDIRSNNKLEKESAKRLAQYQGAVDEIKKTGKNKFLLEEKERALKYFKKQREIQHRHFHAMLKMAHASMERLSKVKGMVGKAQKTGKITKEDMEELTTMVPGSTI